MNTINIKLYDFARQKLKLSEDDAKEFVRAIDEHITDDIKASVGEYKSIVKEDFLKMDVKIEQVRGEIKDSKNDTLKWFIGCFIALALMILGLYLKK